MTTDAMTRMEPLLVSLDSTRGGAVTRVAIGFMILPALSRSWGSEASGWALVMFFTASLFALKLMPAIVRRVFAFSSAAQAVWSARRQMAIRYDSYQWQKLFWLGAGLASYMVIAGENRASRLALVAVCLASGAVGLSVWLARGVGPEFMKRRVTDAQAS